MGQILLPRAQVVDSNGNPLNGAKAYFYSAGTTTPLTVYSNEGLTVAHSSPVVADAAGRFAPIYSNASFKISVYDRNDALVYTVDNLKPFELGTSADSDIRLAIATSPLDYGAVGDGVADEASEVQDAIDNASEVIDLAGKTYRCDSRLTMASNKTIVNGVLDFSQCTDSICVAITGSLGNTSSLTASPDVGAIQVSLASTSGFAANEWLQVSGFDNWYSTLPVGEFARVRAVPSGTELDLDAPLFGAYATTPTVTKLTLVENVRFQNVRFVGANASTQRCIDAFLGNRIVVRDCKFSGFYTSGVRLRACIYSVVENCDALDTQSGSPIDIDSCQFVQVNHAKVQSFESVGIKVGSGNLGIDRCIYIRDCHVVGEDGQEFGIHLGAASQYCTVTHCNVSGYGGIKDEGCDNKIADNEIRNTSDPAIQVIMRRSLSQTYANAPTDGQSSRVEGNKVIDCANGISVNVPTGSVGGRGVYVCKNVVSGPGNIIVDMDVDAYDVHVDENMLDGGYALLTSGTNIDIENFSFDRNSCVSGTTTIGADAGTGGALRYGSITGNKIAGTDVGIFASDCVSSLISDNIVNSTSNTGTDYALDVKDCNSCLVKSNILSGSDYSIYVHDCTDISVIDNDCSGYDEYAIRSTGTTAIVVRGNKCEGSTPTADISLDDIVSGLIADNECRTGSLVVNAGTDAVVAMGKNVVLSGSITCSCTTSFEDLNIHDNVVDRAAGATPLSISLGDGTTKNVCVRNNSARGSHTNGMLLISNASNGTLTNALVSGNMVVNGSTSAGARGIRITGDGTADVWTRIFITGNVVVGGEYGIGEDTTFDVTTAVAAGNLIQGYGTGAVTGTWTSAATTTTAADMPNHT